MPRVKSSILAATILACATAFGLSACGGGGTGGGGTSATVVTPPTPVAQSGFVNTLVTDGASSKWSHIIIPVKTIKLVLSTDASKTVTIYDGGTSPVKVDFLTLNGVAQLIAKASVVTGTWDTVEMTVDTTPANITLTDLSGQDVATSLIKVDGNGVISVPLKSPLTVSNGATANLQIEFALNDPTFVSKAPDGSYLIHFVLRHKELPSDPTKLQMRETHGDVSEVTATGFTVTNEAGKPVTFAVDTKTEYFDASTKTTGSLAGLKVGAKAVVQSRLETTGTQTATRVTYGSGTDKVSESGQTTYIFAVDTTNKKLKVYDGKGRLTDVTYDDNTKIYFKGDTANPLPASALQSPFLVSVDVKDASATTPLALVINIRKAVDFGPLKSATTSSLTFTSGLSSRKDQTFNASTAPNVTYTLATDFKWWMEGKSDAPQDAAALATALAAPSAEPLKGELELTWDATAKAWKGSSLEAEGFATDEGAAVTTAYDATTKTVTVTYTSEGKTKTKTYTLVDIGNEPTQVLLSTKTANGVTITKVAVADWAKTLTLGAKVLVDGDTKGGKTVAEKVVVYTGF